MSALPMKKTCPFCRRMFTFNPSVGDFGLTCPYCFRSSSVGSTIGKTIAKLLNTGKGK